MLILMLMLMLEHRKNRLDNFGNTHNWFQILYTVQF